MDSVVLLESALFRPTADAQLHLVARFGTISILTTLEKESVLHTDPEL